MPTVASYRNNGHDDNAEIEGMSCQNGVSVVRVKRLVRRVVSYCGIGALAFFIWNAGSIPGLAQNIPDSSSAGPAIDAPHPGVIVVEITYDEKGDVQACQLVRSNAPYQLEKATQNYIRKNWKFSSLGSGTALLPVIFDQVPDTKYWDEDLASPPNLFPYTDRQENMALRVRFGASGWVDDVKILHPSGNQLVDRQTALWIRVHWHHLAYANKTVDVPFEFVRPPPPPPPPPAAAVVPPVVKKPVVPRPPPEPAPIPAVRAQ